MALLDGVPSLALRLAPEIRRTGSLSEAARAVGVSQPAATKAIQRAEAALGVALMRRDVRPLALTAEGELLADHAERVAEIGRVTAGRLARAAEGDGLVRIASFGPSASTHILPQLLERLARRLPAVTVEITELAGPAALAALRDGRVDFATLLAHAAPDLEVLHVARDRLIALVREGSPLAALRAIDAARLAAEPFILSKGGSEDLIRHWFGAAGLVPPVRHTAQQITSIIAMVRRGLGASVIAEMAVPASHPGVVLVPLDPAQDRTIGIARRGGSFASHAARLVWRAIEDAAAEAPVSPSAPRGQGSSPAPRR